ncbi:hypothetical protein [Thauera humireducens]|uniref:hypothetical protein n=1 Tax=Thauera humireducens TaxID=1134435 RepID=UPI0009EDA5DF
MYLMRTRDGVPRGGCLNRCNQPGFNETGRTIAAWAKAHGFPPHVVDALLRGRPFGKRGEARLIAIALRHKSTQRH